MSATKSFSVGIADIPNQIHYSSRKERITLNIALLGNAESGKTSLINRALLAKVFGGEGEDFTGTESQESTVKIRVRQQEFVEDGIRAHLRLINVPMMGYSITKQAGNEALLHYIADGQAAFLETLMSVERFDSKSIVENDDPRVHLCIYFVQPHGPAYGLSCFEIALLRELSLMSNLIICLPKADTMLPHEQSLFRQKIMNDIRGADIHLFKQNCEEDLWLVSGIATSPDSEEVDSHNAIQNRNYPWGSYCPNSAVEATSQKASLEEMLIRKYLPDLLDTTDDLFARYCSSYAKSDQAA